MLGVGVAKAVEDDQSLLPRVTGSVMVFCCVVGVAKVGEGGCFVVMVAEFSEQVESVLVAGDGCGVVAKAVMSSLDAVNSNELGVRLAG